MIPSQKRENSVFEIPHLIKNNNNLKTILEYACQGFPDECQLHLVYCRCQGAPFCRAPRECVNEIPATAGPWLGGQPVAVLAEFPVINRHPNVAEFWRKNRGQSAVKNCLFCYLFNMLIFF